MAEKQKVLIVDDDANIAELISLYLEKECFETQIVGQQKILLPAELSFQKFSRPAGKGSLCSIAYPYTAQTSLRLPSGSESPPPSASNGRQPF